MTHVRALLLIGLLGLFAAALAQDCTGELAADTSTDLSSVPEGVLSAARERAGVELTNLSSETEGGRTVYEISGIDENALTACIYGNNFPYHVAY